MHACKLRTDRSAGAGRTLSPKAFLAFATSIIWTGCDLESLAPLLGISAMKGKPEDSSKQFPWLKNKPQNPNHARNWRPPNPMPKTSPANPFELRFHEFITPTVQSHVTLPSRFSIISPSLFAWSLSSWLKLLFVWLPWEGNFEVKAPCLSSWGADNLAISHCLTLKFQFWTLKIVSKRAKCYSATRPVNIGPKGSFSLLELASV